MLRIFLHLASKGLVSNCFFLGTFTPPSLDLTLAFPACRADTPSAKPSKITDGVAWVKNNSAWLVPEFSSKQQNSYYSISVQRGYSIVPLDNYVRSDLKIPLTADRKRSTKSQHHYNIS